MQDPDAAHLEDADPGQDPCVGHKHEGELPDVGAGDIGAGGEAGRSKNSSAPPKSGTRVSGSSREAAGAASWSR
jgi:hypothetical protein